MTEDEMAGWHHIILYKFKVQDSSFFNLGMVTFKMGEGNGNPLQHSCLENPRDGASWWAAVYGVAQSRTRLK